jgi:L-iditol 2-dehydrogenase
MEYVVRAVVYRGPTELAIDNVPVPALLPGDVLIRVAGCGLCGSDLLKIASGAPPPLSLGHELSGEVVASEDAAIPPGRRVVVAHHVPCGACHYCRAGSPTMCAAFRASRIDPCGFAEFVRVPAAHVSQVMLELPDTVSHTDAAFVEPLACCLRAVGRVQAAGIERIAVLGLGSMGLLMVQALGHRFPAARIIGVDPLTERRALALRLGVAQALAPEEDVVGAVRDASKGPGADLTVLTAAFPGALGHAHALVRDGGEVLLFATGPELREELTPWDWYHAELRLTASYSSTPADLRAALRLIATGRIRVAELISHRVPLEAFHEGVRLARSHQALKVYVEPRSSARPPAASGGSEHGDRSADL